MRRTALVQLLNRVFVQLLVAVGGAYQRRNDSGGFDLFGGWLRRRTPTARSCCGAVHLLVIANKDLRVLLQFSDGIAARVKHRRLTRNARLVYDLRHGSSASGSVDCGDMIVFGVNGVKRGGNSSCCGCAGFSRRSRRHRQGSVCDSCSTRCSRRRAGACAAAARGVAVCSSLGEVGNNGVLLLGVLLLRIAQRAR